MRSKSSKKWLERHFSDPYVQRAQKEGRRSRAAFKLQELQHKDRFIKPGMIVVDLGAAPGGWSEVVAELVGPKGRVIALDRLPMAALVNVEFIQGDFTEDSIYQELVALVGERKIDVVISDMAPNLSGIVAADQSRTIYLAELALDFAIQVLKNEGSLLVKIFQGAEFDVYLKELRKRFKTVKIRKPSASRAQSKEVYLLALGYKSD